MGIVTGKGLADLIRENAGVKITFFIFIGLLIADIGNTTTEFAGVAGSLEIFGVSKYISVPVVAVMIWFMVVKGNYKIAERIFLIFSVALLMYVVSALMGKPHWKEIGHSVIHPEMKMNTQSIEMIIGIIGTTIAPWMQFYMQSSVIEKGLKMRHYKFILVDIIVGCLATVVVAFFIMVACASTLHINNIVINEAKDAAMALKPLAGAISVGGVCLRTVYRFDLFCHNIATGNGFLCLRSLWLRSRDRQEMERSSAVLLALYRHHRSRCDHHSHSQCSADRYHAVVADHQRAASSVCTGLHDPPGK